MNQRSRYLDSPKKHFGNFSLVWLCLGAMLVIQVVLLFYFAAQRQGYHVDELFTYFLSNNSAPNAPYPKNESDYLATWHTADYFRSFLTCDPSEQFQFGFVYMNQCSDVLGPLYFVLFHLVCSFVPGTFSIYPIVAMHAALFVLSGILLWQMGRRLLHSDWAALLPVALWGFSAGAVSAGLYLRVYALLLFFLVLITFLAFRVAEHALYGEGPCISKRYVAAIAFATAGGLLTHYYFVLYTLFLGLTLGAYLLLQHRKQDLRRALCGVFLGVGGGILIFPASIMQAFTSYRGQGAWEKIAQGGPTWKEVLEAYLDAIRTQLFHSMRVEKYIFILLGILGILVLVRAILKRKKPAPETICRAFELLMAAVGCIGYIIFVALVAPYSVSRYVYPVFPIVLFLVGALFYLGCRVLFQNQKLRAACGVCIFLLAIGLSSFMLGRGNIENILPEDWQTRYTGTRDVEEKAAQYEGAYALVYYPKIYVEHTYCLFPEFLHYSGACFLPEEEKSQLPALASEVPDDAPLLLYAKFSTGNVMDQVLEIAHAFGRTQAEALYPDREFMVYRLS